MNDNIRNKHREAFEEIYVATQKDLLARMVKAKMPNEYTETIIGRMIAMRAAVNGEEVGPVTDRCDLVALDYVTHARKRLVEVIESEEYREKAAAMQDANKGTKH